MNPLDWTGTEFLTLYVPLLVVGFFVAKALRRPPRPPGEPLQLGKRLDPYEVALLHGLRHFRDAVAASLIHRGVFRVEGNELLASKTPPLDMTPLERNVLRASGRQPLSPALLATALEPEAARVREQLIQKGLLISKDQDRETRRTPLILFGLVLALGVAKTVVGLSRDKPVSWLIFLLVVGFIGWALIAKQKRGRTPLGDMVLADLATEHAALRTTAAAEGSLPTLSGTEVALAVALFGTTALASTQMMPLRQYLQPMSPATSTSGGGDFGCGGGDTGWSTSSSGWSSDSGSSDSSSSSDSGGSDSGGGGCGGCGGGGGD
jgi:uncharacterized protein (TIGR04222 family)